MLAEASSSRTTQLILSADDEPAILTTREMLLESAGYKVLSAADGEQALSLFARNPVDLVLLAFAMAGLNGSEVAQELKSRNAAVPIIMVSASPLLGDTIPCVDCFIQKGQGPKLLLEQMDQLLTSQSIRQHAKSVQYYVIPGGPVAPE